MVNVECRAFADNIDYEKRNRRGLTKFSLFVDNKTKSKTADEPKEVSK
jgi:hypothetical protein